MIKSSGRLISTINSKKTTNLIVTKYLIYRLKFKTTVLASIFKEHKNSEFFEFLLEDNHDLFRQIICSKKEKDENLLKNLLKFYSPLFLKYLYNSFILKSDQDDLMSRLKKNLGK